MKKYDMNKSLGYIIAKTNWLMKTHFKNKIKENNIDITPEQWTVLNAINNNPGISQTEIAKISIKDKANITRILDIVEKKKYIVRNSQKNDRRVYNISLTTKGENVLERLIIIAEEANNSYISGLQSNQVAYLFKILNTIGENID